MHTWLAALAILTLSLPTLAQAQGRGGGPPRPIAGNGVEIPGWWARLDNPKDSRDGLKVAPAGSGIHAMTGPNAIYWDPQQEWDGEYTVKATFTLNKPASHQVAYGLFIGGTDLAGDDQAYTYFVIRQDGRYLIKKRTGATTTNVAGDWAEHAAVMKPEASGTQANELSIRVTGDTVVFMANGKDVAMHPASAVNTAGVAGLRIGHGLDVQIDGFDVTEDGAGGSN